MSTRIISSIFLTLFIFIFIFSGGIVLKIGIILLSLIAMYEFFKVIYNKILLIHYLSFITSFTYLCLLGTSYSDFYDVIFGTFLILTLVLMVIKHKEFNIYDVSLSFFAVFYITVVFSAIYLIRGFSYGEFTVWIPFICGWTCDTGAYFTGKVLGKRKLTPELSPNKTIEGAIGGLISSCFICGLYGLLISKFYAIEGHIFNNTYVITIIFSIFGIIGAVFAQFGDLAASAIKRKFNIKDYGYIIPGHGGILDRFDSIIFTTGTVYIILRIIEDFN